MAADSLPDRARAAGLEIGRDAVARLDAATVAAAAGCQPAASHDVDEAAAAVMRRARDDPDWAVLLDAIGRARNRGDDGPLQAYNEGLWRAVRDAAAATSTGEP